MIRWAPLAAVIVALAAPGTRAQSLVEEAPEDACEGARALDISDTTPAAEHVRRSCRLERFEDRLAADRRQQVAVEEQSREARVQQWIDSTQPSRVTHPMAFEGFVGTGLASYGFSFAWDFLRRAEASVWIGFRPISCQDQNGGETGDCGRTAFGLRGRWYLTDHDVTPFVDTGLSLMTSALQVNSMSSGSLLTGTGRANSLSAGAGLTLAVRAFRMSLEYVFEYTFYTGASLDDTKKTPSPELDTALANSLRADRNGVRFQVGYGF
ncbi:MAG TPA: hypothetical protein VH853_12995 [Polyangia bacterium]|nr:hypothetical protein [Polyangia bacterium]